MGRRIQANRKSDRLRALRFATAFVALFAALLSSARADETKPLLPKWTITELDSRYVIRDAPLYWIDNDRVLFSAFFRDPPISDRKALIDQFRAENPRQIYAWTIGGGVTRFKTHVGDYCYANGRVFRSVKLEGFTPFRDIWDLLTGKLYEPQTFFTAWLWPGTIIDTYGPRIFYVQGEVGRETADSRRANLGAEFRFDEINCDILQRPSEMPDTPNWLALLPGDGYLRFENASRKSIVRYERTLTSAKELPIEFDRRVSWAPVVTFHPFQRAYFLWQPAVYWATASRVQNEGECRFAYWLYPDGRTDKLCIPAGPWSRWMKHGRSVVILPIKRGVIVIKFGTGAYLISEGRAETVIESFMGQPRVEDRPGEWGGKFSNRIERNVIKGANVSPNGCRVAVVYAADNSEYEQTGGRRIGVIDFCRDHN